MGAEPPYVVGVRFQGSARVNYFLVEGHSIAPGTWVAAPGLRGLEAGCVVIAPRQILLAQLDGDLPSIDGVLSEEDVARMERLRNESRNVAKRAEDIAHQNGWHIERIGAQYSFDGTRLLVSCFAPDQNVLTQLQGALENEFGLAVEMQSVGQQEEARLLGGLGRHGGSPGSRSRENERYAAAKQLLPSLGQRVTTEQGEGVVVALQVFDATVTVRYADPQRDVSHSSAELLPGEQGWTSPGTAAPSVRLTEETGGADSPIGGDEHSTR